MSTIILDDALKEKLGNLQDHVDVVDPSGTTLGCFLPQDQYIKLLYAWAKTEFTDEEIERGREDYRKNGGYTTEQVLAYLKSLDDYGESPK